MRAVTEDFLRLGLHIINSNPPYLAMRRVSYVLAYRTPAGGLEILQKGLYKYAEQAGKKQERLKNQFPIFAAIKTLTKF